MKLILFSVGVVLTLLSSLPLLHAQSRDFRAQRLVLDDNGADGVANTITLNVSNPLPQNRSLTIPDPGVAVASFLLSESSSPQVVNADVSFAGTVTFSSGAPSFGLVAGELLFGDPGGSGGFAQSGNLLWNGGANLLEVNGDLDVKGHDLLGTANLVGTSSGNLELVSNGSLVINIDDDNSGTGSSFVVEVNGAASDLLAVAETGLTTITSSSGTGGLRVRNTNASGTANILELSDGTTPHVVVRRNGNVGIGTVPNARLDVENSSGSEPALRLRNTSGSGVGLEIAEGSFVASVQSVAGGGTIANSALIVEATGATLSAPAGGTNGQIIYVVNTTAAPVTLSGLATDGTNTNSSIPQGGAATIIKVNGAWFAVDRN
ncbi:MAG: hypothetical protein KDD67_18655 [Ignavibacteriae bacterium]|nr:hypothetical protein [Ignavibacteriota bacterium]MCB9217525.1 hypothetical protein [Ignavibacteria bacterium]